MSEYVAEISEELMAGFFDEAPDYLEILDDGLMAFEEKVNAGSFSLQAEEDQARMNEMFRAAHSLKGLGAALGFDKIRDLTHLMETLFDHVRMGKHSLDQTAIETLFGVFDKLKELAEPPEQPVSIEESLAKLQAILSAPGEADSDQQAAPMPQPTASDSSQEQPPAAETGHAQVENPGDKPAQKASPAEDSPAVTPKSEILDNAELAQLFVETTLETLDELNEALLKLENSSEDEELINSVFRCAHNIKGATGAAGCMALYHMMHDMETALDRVRNHQQSLDAPLMQSVFGAVDRVRADINLIKAGRVDELSSEGTKGVFDQWLACGSEPSPPSTDGPEESLLDAEDGEAVVKVMFPKDFAEAEIQAYLIHNKLKETGDILETIPDVDALDGSTALEEITYRIQTTATADELKRLVESYSVQSVSISGGSIAESASDICESSSLNEETHDNPSETTAPAAPAVKTAQDASPPATKSQTPAPAPAAASKANQPAAGKTSGSVPAAAVKKKTPVKVGETIRVDLERLDQLMNLGGELVINKARLTQIHGRFDPLFQGQNLEFLVDDMSERVAKLNAGLSELPQTSAEGRRIAELSEAALHLSHDFKTVKGLVQRVHDGRGVMNDFSEALHALSRVSEGMQKRIMETRMVAVGPLFQRFRRVVRDIARGNGKNVELILRGEGTEMDKRMIDELGDPLTHMIRNSVDHGLESPEDRAKAGKPPTGQVILEAYHRGRHICIEVRDDGRGIDVEAVKRKIVERELAGEAEVERMSEKEIIQYVFKPGFSTAQKVTDLSGRGMGMDIVVNKLEAINGTAEIESVTGQGTTVTIKLPLTLAIITSILARIGRSVYAVPLEAVAEIITVPQSSIQYIQKKRVVRVRERVIPVAFFEQIFDTDSPELLTVSRDDTNLTLVILEMQDESIGLVVDELIGQEDVVIKSIAENYRNVTGITGASIMGDGTVSLILDVASITNMFTNRCERHNVPNESERETSEEAPSSIRKELAHACAD